MTAQSKAKARIREARAELDSALVVLQRGIRPWRRSFERRRTAWLVAGGFASGFALSFLPPRLWAKVGGLVGSGAALMARSLVTPMIAGAVLGRRADRTAATTGTEPGATH